MNNTELTHWGVKGMKWGVRRAQKRSDRKEAAYQKRKAKLEKKMNFELNHPHVSRAAKIGKGAVKGVLATAGVLTVGAAGALAGAALTNYAYLNEVDNFIRSI